MPVSLILKLAFSRALRESWLSSKALFVVSGALFLLGYLFADDAQIRQGHPLAAPAFDAPLMALFKGKGFMALFPDSGWAPFASVFIIFFVIFLPLLLAFIFAFINNHIFQENARREWRERPINPLFPILSAIGLGLVFTAPSWEAAFIEAPFAVALAGAFWAALQAFRFLREGSDDEPAHFRSLPRLGRIACGVFAAALLLFVAQGALHGADWSEAFASAAENPWRWAQLVAAILFSWAAAVIWIAMFLARGASSLRRRTLRRIASSRWSPSAAFRSLELWVRPTPEELASWESKLIDFELRKPLRSLFRPKARRRETL